MTKGMSLRLPSPPILTLTHARALTPGSRVKEHEQEHE